MIGDIIECKRENDLYEGGGFFSSSSPVICDNRVYSVDYYRKLHIYNIDTRKWNAL